jgi:tRNA-splicing ligase RtcB
MSKLDKLKLLLPMEEIEPEAQQQLFYFLEQDFLVAAAAMPDVHSGYLLCIGGVVLLDGVVCPEAVGYDIHCGVCARIFNVPAHEVLTGRRQTIFKKIYNKIPVGPECRIQGLDYDEFVSALGDKKLDQQVNAKLRIQLGTLGGGNHFIEVGRNQAGNVAIVIHSGSRKPGHTLAGHYMKLAHKVDKHLPGPFLDVTSDTGKAFLEDLAFMEGYTYQNRLVMMDQVTKILGLEKEDCLFINEHHNSATVTSKGILHRKGATPAEKGQYGLIPGNMRDGCYITIGLGNEEYLCSASHGAGRRMGRKAAERTLDLEEFRNTMVDVVAKVDQSTLDEAPMAYKDLSQVIARQDGIVVDVIDHITPLINIKG